MPTALPTQNPNRKFQEQGAAVYAPTPATSDGAAAIAKIGSQSADPVSASTLTSPASLPYLPQPTVAAPPVVPSLDDIFNSSRTPAQEEQQGILNSIAGESATLAGQSTYQDQQEQAAGIPTLKKTVNDLTNQLNNLNAQSQQIPLQVQNDYVGRGATAAGVEPIQTAQLRNISIQQLGVSAALNAANGNLATAQDQVDAAVKAKFDPLQAEIDAQQAQLQALAPTLTADEQKQAAKVQAQLQERQDALDQQKTDQTAILQTMTTAAANGADAVTIRNIQNAATPEDAVAAAGTYLATPSTTLVDLGNGYQQLINSQTGQVIKTFTGGSGSGASQSIATLDGKPLTSTQATAYGYGQRMVQDDQIINNLGGQFTGVLNYITGSSYFPNSLKSDDRQKLEQAERDFVNATLRQESGAAISQSEFDSAMQQYFPQPGDSAAVLAQKAQARQTKIQGMAVAANVAVDQLASSAANGSSSNSKFVEQALDAQGISYSDLLTQMQSQQAQYPGMQPALDATTGKPAFATPQEIASGQYVAL